jgi:hypothetical protein
MRYESFNHSVDDYAAELTAHSHQTLYWLNRHGYLDDEDFAELLGRMVVVPIRNNPKFGERILNRLFRRDSTENSFTFPITLIDAIDDQEEDVPQKGKPNLTVVE